MAQPFPPSLDSFYEKYTQKIKAKNRPALPQPISPMPPSSDEVARRAYFPYVNQGSLAGREVQHWLTAEVESIAERNVTHVHQFGEPRFG
jgi:hypothetical protein